MPVWLNKRVDSYLDGQIGARTRYSFVTGPQKPQLSPDDSIIYSIFIHFNFFFFLIITYATRIERPVHLHPQKVNKYRWFGQLRWLFLVLSFCDHMPRHMPKMKKCLRGILKADTRMLFPKIYTHFFALSFGNSTQNTDSVWRCVWVLSYQKVL